MCASKKRKAEIYRSSSSDSDEYPMQIDHVTIHNDNQMECSSPVLGKSNPSPVLRKRLKEPLRKRQPNKFSLDQFEDDSMKTSLVISQFYTPESVSDDYLISSDETQKESKAQITDDSFHKFIQLFDQASKKMVISQFCSQESNNELEICELSSQEATNTNQENISASFSAYTSKQKKPKSTLSINILKSSNIEQAKIAIWKHENAKGISLTPEEENYALKLRLRSCNEEFNNYILRCSFLDTSQLFASRENFNKYVIDFNVKSVKLNEINKNECLVIVGYNVSNLKFESGLEFYLYPPYNIKVDSVKKICYFLSCYKILCK